MPTAFGLRRFESLRRFLLFVTAGGDGIARSLRDSLRRNGVQGPPLVSAQRIARAGRGDGIASSLRSPQLCAKDRKGWAGGSFGGMVGYWWFFPALFFWLRLFLASPFLLLGDRSGKDGNTRFLRDSQGCAKDRKGCAGGSSRGGCAGVRRRPRAEGGAGSPGLRARSRSSIYATRRVNLGLHVTTPSVGRLGPPCVRPVCLTT